MLQNEMENLLYEAGAVPLVTPKDAVQAVTLGRTILSAGTRVMEIAFRNENAQNSIYAVSTQIPEMFVLAGTVVTLDQAKAAAATGADAVVCPGLDPEIVTWCQENGMPVFPGCATATEIQSALKLGLNTVKFFPAEAAGGVELLKALHAPFPNVRFIPTGGVNAENFSGYIGLPYVLCCAGSWLCPESSLNSADWGKISSLVGDARVKVRAARQV